MDEKGKEFHLEMIFKLMILGYNFGEVPAVLEWKDNKLLKLGSKKRKSSSRIPKLILSHLNFAVFSNPIRYFWTFSLLCFLGGAGFLALSLYRLFAGQVAIYLALTGLFLGSFALLFLGFGIVTGQNNLILKNLWRQEITLKTKLGTPELQVLEFSPQAKKSQISSQP